MIYMNTKTDKRNFLTPTYRHNGVLTMQYYEVENVSKCLLLVTILFREICSSKYYLFASNIHEKDLSFNEQDLLQS